MRVTFNSQREESLIQISRHAAKQARLQAQISSGQKISAADEDPSSARKILSLQSTSAQAQQYYRNAGDALGISQASYQVVDQLRGISDRVGEIVSGVSSLTAPDSFQAYATEVDELIKQALAASSQQFDGQYLLSGTRTDTQPFTVTNDANGKVSSVSYAGAAEGPSIQISENATIAPYLDGNANADIGDFINRLVATREALTNGDTSAISNLRPALLDSENSVLGTLGQVAAQQRRLELSRDAASSRYDETAGHISRLNDVDMSTAIVELTQSQTAYQAALQATAKIMSRSLLDYL